MAHMQENPQNAGKDTRMPAAGETRQMPLRADRPVQAAQAPYPLQGRPAPTERVAAPFAFSGGNDANGVLGASAVPSGNGGNGMPGANVGFASPGAGAVPGANGVAATEAASGSPAANGAFAAGRVNVAPNVNAGFAVPGANGSAAEEEMAPERKGLGGLLEGLSVPQVAAGALAAVTSMLLSSKIGIAGSVIGVAVGSVVSTVASQVYKQFLQASADKLRELNPLDEAGAGPVAGETRVMPEVAGGSSATRVMGAVPASGGDSAANRRSGRFRNPHPQRARPARKRRDGRAARPRRASAPSAHAARRDRGVGGVGPGRGGHFRRHHQPGDGGRRRGHQDRAAVHRYLDVANRRRFHDEGQAERQIPAVHAGPARHIHEGFRRTGASGRHRVVG